MWWLVIFLIVIFWGFFRIIRGNRKHRDHAASAGPAALSKAAETVPARQLPSLASAVKDTSRAPDKWTYDIVYVDADGGPSSRRIDVHEIYGSPAMIYINAYCHLRRGKRTFRTDRIHEMSEAATGELIEDPCAYLYAIIQERSDGGSAFRSVIQRARKGLCVLVWCALADNDLSVEEMEVLLDYIEARDRLGNGGERDWKRPAAAAWIEGLFPRKYDAQEAVKKFTKDGKEAQLVAEFAGKILEIQRNHEKRTSVKRRFAQLGFKGL